MSPPRTASTLLVNVVHGLYDPFSPVIAEDSPPKVETNIIKTHNCSYRAWTKNYPEHKLYFVCSERREIEALIPYKNNICIDNEFVLHDNVVVFRYDELLYARRPLLVQRVERRDVVHKIAKKLESVIPIPQNIDAAVARASDMDDRCAEIADKPFSFYDEYYHIHGSHRERGKYRY